MSGQRPWGPHSTKNQTLRKVPFQFLPRVYELNRRDRLNSVGFDTGDDHREEARMRHFFGTSLFVAIMLAFQAIEPSSGGEPIAVTLRSQREKKWETHFSTRGRWFVPT